MTIIIPFCTDVIALNPHSLYVDGVPIHTPYAAGLWLVIQRVHVAARVRGSEAADLAADYVFALPIGVPQPRGVSVRVPRMTRKMLDDAYRGYEEDKWRYAGRAVQFKHLLTPVVTTFPKRDD